MEAWFADLGLGVGYRLGSLSRIVARGAAVGTVYEASGMVRTLVSALILRGARKNFCLPECFGLSR